MNLLTAVWIKNQQQIDVNWFCLFVHINKVHWHLPGHWALLHEWGTWVTLICIIQFKTHCVWSVFKYYWCQRPRNMLFKVTALTVYPWNWKRLCMVNWNWTRIWIYFRHQFLPNGHYHIAPLIKLWHTCAVNNVAVSMCALCQKQCGNLSSCLYRITGSGLCWTVFGAYQIVTGWAHILDRQT